MTKIACQKEILVKGNISNAVMVIQMREITRFVIKMGDGFLKVSGDADMSFFQPLDCIQGFSEICDNLQKWGGGGGEEKNSVFIQAYGYLMADCQES